MSRLSSSLPCSMKLPRVALPMVPIEIPSLPWSPEAHRRAVYFLLPGSGLRLPTPQRFQDLLNILLNILCNSCDETDSHMNTCWTGLEWVWPPPGPEHTVYGKKNKKKKKKSINRVSSEETNGAAKNNIEVWRGKQGQRRCLDRGPICISLAH